MFLMGAKRIAGRCTASQMAPRLPAVVFCRAFNTDVDNSHGLPPPSELMRFATNRGTRCRSPAALCVALSERGCGVAPMMFPDPKSGMTTVRSNTWTTFYPCRVADTMHHMRHAREARSAPSFGTVRLVMKLGDPVFAKRVSLG